MLRITAVSAGAVEYLIRGSGCAGHEHGPKREQDPAREREQSPELAPGGDADQTPAGAAARYFGAAVEHGEPAGRWGGRGLALFGYGAGDAVQIDDVRAIFGNLQDPTSGDSLGRAPRQYKKTAERVEAALQAAGDDLTPEQRREVEIAAAADGRKAVAYYDFTFSPAKSVSVYYAALLAAGEFELAAKVAAAHDRAVETAMAYAEEHVGYTRTGYHGRTTDGRSVGRYEAGAGLIWTGWKHSTNRESEPQLHTHVAVLNRIKTISDGVIRALDGRGFRPVKEAIATAYERALEEEITRETGAVFADRPDGKAREIVGVDPALCAEASTRRAQTLERADELVEVYVEQNGRVPDAAAMKKIMHDAAMGTRRPKEGPQGPAAVAAWGSEAGRQARLVATVEAVADAAEYAAVAGHPDVAAGVRMDPAVPEQRAALLAAAVADVQHDYATWTLGNLVAAIDRRVGVLPAEAAGQGRPAFLENLAREAVAPGNTAGVVLLTAPDPVEVPEELRRAEDGRSVFRPHADERYATVEQLAAEERIVVGARQETAPEVRGPELELLRVELAAAGLGPDQVDAVAGIMSSGRAGDVLIGPAGTGKSYTVAALTQAWSDRFGGQVLGLATSEIAAQNLAEDGVPAMNTARFLALYGPRDDGSPPRLRLGARDLVVIDEAGMSGTPELERISAMVGAAGAKLLYSGDSGQLTSVGAGGMLALLAGDNGAFELVEVHRFAHEWERDASLRLRAGDRSVIAEYQDRGRLRGGTLEEMTAAAMRGYLADTLAGRDSLLIVRTNNQAAELSRAIRDQLIDAGRVDDTPLVLLGERAGKVPVSVGDVVQARMVDRTIRVDGGGIVANRELFTVVGMDEDGQLLVRNATGGVAHLPRSYLEQHLTLGYASTVNAAPGRTVDTCHALLDEAAAREAAYVALSRGREENLAYLVSERAPDAHDAQRLDATAASRLAGVLGNVEAEHSAVVEQRIGAREGASLAWIGGQWDLVSAESAALRYADALTEALTAAAGGGDPDGPPPQEVASRVAAVTGEDGWARLVRAVREAELAGHNPHALLGEAVAIRSLGDADQVTDVLRWRVRNLTGDREPEQLVGVGDWTALAPPVDGPVGQFSHELAVLAGDRQFALGQAALEAPPGWALVQLGPAPDYAGLLARVDAGEAIPTEEIDAVVAARMEWAQRAGAVAAYRDLRGIADDVVSIGAAPGQEEEFHRAAWTQAAAALGLSLDTDGRGDPGAVDYRTLDDHELYAARERWAREQAWAPAYVAQEMRSAYELARGYHEDAAITAAQLAQLPEGDPTREAVAEQLARTERLAELAGERARQLEDIHQSRAGWYGISEDARVGDELARDELERRGLPAQREPVIAEQLELFDPAQPQEGLQQGPAVEVEPQHEQQLEQAEQVELVDRPEGVDVDVAVERDVPAVEDTRDARLPELAERPAEVGPQLDVDDDTVELANDRDRDPRPAVVEDPAVEPVADAMEPELAGTAERGPDEIEPKVEPVEQLELFDLEPAAADLVAAEPLRHPAEELELADVARDEAAELADAQERAELTIAQARAQAAAVDAQRRAREAAEAARAEQEQRQAEAEAQRAAAERAAEEEAQRQRRDEIERAAEQAREQAGAERARERETAEQVVDDGPSIEPGFEP